MTPGTSVPAPRASDLASGIEPQREMTMKLFAQNVGTADRILRVAIGAALISLAFVGPRTPWGYVGLVPLVTAFAGTCPLYSLFGIRSCPAREA